MSRTNPESLLPELIQRITKMEVATMADGTRVQPNRIYVTPPNCDVSVLHGKIHLLEPVATGGLRLPIDFFLRSLAADLGRQAAGVILSGSGSDGVLGLKAVKENEGLVLAQEPQTCTHDSMPRHAIATGLVDDVAPPEKLPQVLVRYFEHAALLARAEAATSEIPATDLNKILVLLRDRTGHDFSAYKKNTLLRRIERQMSLQRIDHVSHYGRLLREHPEELDALFRDILIGVTNFFRDPEAFESLKHEVLPALIRTLADDEPLRIWVPGCSTGEEVYSLGMVLRECLSEQPRNLHLQIFGTDIDVHALGKARAGVYPLSIAAEVSQQRLQRFFNQEDAGYRVRRELRDCIVFSAQNILQDPPFSRLHLVCCRNLLIYIDSAAQKQIIPLFHFTLKPGGILFLGSSETIGESSNLFAPAVAKWKIFRRKTLPAAAQPMVSFPTRHRFSKLGKEAFLHGPVAAGPSVDVAQLARELLLADFAPACIVIDRQSRIRYIHGRSGRYLEPPAGSMSDNVVDMARQGLKLELATAIRKVLATDRPVVRRGVNIRTESKVQPVELTVRPLAIPGAEAGLLAIVLRDEPAPADISAGPQRATAASHDKAIAELEEELRHARESRQAAMEELETTNEELKSINEELQSSNEELMSTNEELESSKEEQQSLNEELMIVNAELQNKVDDLSRIHDDLRNFLEAIRIATIILDQDLCIKRFTTEATRIVNLISGDIGRPFAHVVTNLEYDGLIDDARRVFNGLERHETEVRTRDGVWYLMAVIPYRTAENVIDGVIMTFVNIDAQKRAQQQSERARDFFHNVVDTVREPLVVLEADLRVVVANRSFYEVFAVRREDTVDRLIYDLGSEQWSSPRLRELLEKIVAENEAFDDFLVEQEFPGIGFRRMLVNARRIPRDRDRDQILLAIEDVTDKMNTGAGRTQPMEKEGDRGG